MTSIADGSVNIQTTSESTPSIPSRFGALVLIVWYLRKHGVLSKISEQVRFARRLLAALRGDRAFWRSSQGYARSFERTLEAFYERLQPCAVPFMAGAGA